MKPQVVEPSLPSLDALSGVESLCLLVTEDERPLQGAAGFLDWRLCGALSRALEASFFHGHPDERLLMPTAGRVPAQRVFAVGLGRQKQVTALGLEHALTRAAQMLGKAQVSSVGLALPELPALSPEALATLVRRGFCDEFSGQRVVVFAQGDFKARLAA